MQTTKNIFSYLLLAVLVASSVPSAAFAATDDGNTVAVERCGNISVAIKGNGAGMIYNDQLVQTYNEHPLINMSEGCAVLEWNTTVPATSQVIFSEFVTGEPVSIDMTANPYYGYDRATTQNNSGEAFHQTVLSELEPGKAYAYRIVSRSHPSALPVVSAEYVIVMQNAPAVPTTTTQQPPVIIHTDAPVEQVDVVITPLGDDDVVFTDTETATDETATDTNATTTNDDVGMWSGFSTWFKAKLSALWGALAHSFDKDAVVLPFILAIVLLGMLHRVLLPLAGLTLPSMPYWIIGAGVLGGGAWFAGWHALAFALGALALLMLAWALLVFASQQDDDTSKKNNEKGTDANEKKETEKTTETIKF